MHAPREAPPSKMIAHGKNIKHGTTMVKRTGRTRTLLGSCVQTVDTDNWGSSRRMFSKKTNFKFKAKFPDPRGHAEKRPAHCSLEFGPNSAVQAKEGAEGSVTNDSQMISKKITKSFIGVSYRRCSIGLAAVNSHTWAQSSLLAQGLNLREGGHSDQTRWP